MAYETRREEQNMAFGICGEELWIQRRLGCGRMRRRQIVDIVIIPAIEQVFPIEKAIPPKRGNLIPRVRASLVYDGRVNVRKREVITRQPVNRLEAVEPLASGVGRNT